MRVAISSRRIILIYSELKLPGVLKTSLDILEDSLEEGNRYRIEVTVTDSNGVGEAKWEVKTNYLPYGGVCKATNKSGSYYRTVQKEMRIVIHIFICTITYNISKFLSLHYRNSTV